jgi:hypothetical protein
VATRARRTHHQFALADGFPGRFKSEKIHVEQVLPREKLLTVTSLQDLLTVIRESLQTSGAR